MKNLFLFFIAVLFFASCKTPKILQNGEFNSRTLKKENTSVLLSKIKTHRYNYHCMSTHYSMDIDIDTVHESFGGTLRLCKDSLIWMTVTPLLGLIEAARIKLTQDSAMVMDRIHDTYFKENYTYVDSVFNNDEVDYELLQSVMTGNNVEYYSDTNKLRAYFDGKQYLLSTVRKRSIRKMLFKNRPLHSKNVEQIIWFDPSDYHITRIRLEDFVNHLTFNAQFEDFNKVDSVNFPYHIQYLIASEKSSVKVDMKYRKVTFKDKEETPFVIPKTYVQRRD